MKKLVCLALALMLSLAICAPFRSAVTKAEESVAYDVVIPEGGNLATNPYNWSIPTLSTAEFSVDETTGVKFNNFVSNQQCTTTYRGGRFGEFKLSMYVNANLNVPDEGKAQWRYSEFFITFLIDRDVDKDFLAEDGKPWYANKVYMSLSIGLTSGGVPICKFLRYNAFAGNCSMSGQNYVGTSVAPVANIADGNKHWVELEVKNYYDEDLGVGGKRMIAYVDGKVAAQYDYEDGEYYDVDTKKDFYVEASSLTGAIGFYANSDWPAGISPNRMNNWFGIEKMTVISYDNNPEGEYVPQCAEPVYEIKSKDYLTAASYMVGDPIEIQLSDLFEYEGTREVSYQVTCNGEPIGTVANGFWAWTPSAAGNYDIDIVGAVSADNKAANYITLRVKGDPNSSSTTEPTNPEPSEPGDSSKPTDSNDSNEGKKGCGGVMGGSLALGMLVITAGAVCLKKRQK